jgi:hypothetical protein
MLIEKDDIQDRYREYVEELCDESNREGNLVEVNAWEH